MGKWCGAEGKGAGGGGGYKVRMEGRARGGGDGVVLGFRKGGVSVGGVGGNGDGYQRTGGLMVDGSGLDPCIFAVIAMAPNF